jgi:hypothetical protein
MDTVQVQSPTVQEDGKGKGKENADVVMQDVDAEGEDD